MYSKRLSVFTLKMAGIILLSPFSLSATGKMKTNLPCLIPIECELNKENILGPHKNSLEEMIDQFPYDDYKQVFVKKLGSFYIDNIQDCIKGLLSRGCAWEPHIANLIKKYAKPGTNVLAIGAHIGTHALTIAKSVGVNGRCIAVEPQLKIFRELYMNMSLNHITNISFLWAAIGDHIGTIELPNFAAFNEGGTPLIASPLLKDGSWSYTEKSGETGVFVDLITIDSLNLENVSLIQIDVESMENAVLDGAKETILRNKPVILIEIMGGSDYLTAPPEIKELIHFTINKIQALGYKVEHISQHDFLALPI